MRFKIKCRILKVQVIHMLHPAILILLTVLKVTLCLSIMHYIRWQNMMGVKNDKFLPIGGGVGVITTLQGLPMNEFCTPEHLPWQHLAQKQLCCTSNVFHGI